MGTLIGTNPTLIFVKKFDDTGNAFVPTGNIASTSGFVPGMNAAPDGAIGTLDTTNLVGIIAVMCGLPDGVNSPPP